MRTTSLLVDDDILVDAGTGVGDLSLEELLRIDHVFLTHSHMDHIACLPLLVDTVWEMRQSPIIVHAPMETLDILRAHIFNWAIWPDFTMIPDAERPALVFEPIVVGQKVVLGERSVSALPANHSVPAVGYLLENENSGSLAFTGDTAACDELWDVLNQVRRLSYLIAETAFPDAQSRLVKAARHLTPSLLADELTALETLPDIYVSHLKPGHVETTSREVESLLHHLRPSLLRQGHVFDV
ncbi:MAG: 3',5'-cyclic-nucleotide phosphodiesterase [Rhodocyclaceae bacterium]|nr:3',5'-cyclic-nucleotide phosphodiesterase [Rhodocyclaceae bacterium]